MMSQKNMQRNYGIDLLRIIAMYMVITLHLLGIGGVLDTAGVLSAQYEAAWFLEIAAYCAVNCYALISGFVGLNAKYKYVNIFILWLKVVFYYTVITLIFAIAIPGSVEYRECLKTLLPLRTSPYWYFKAYFCLFFFIPFLNKAVEVMEREQIKIGIIGLVVIFSIWQTMFRRDVLGTETGYSGLWLMILYIIGAYIKKYDLLSKLSTKKALAGYFLMILLTWGVKFFTEFGADRIWQENGTISLLVNYLLGDGNSLISYISPTILGAGIFLLVLFKNIVLSDLAKKIIAVLSPATFSVYIIHAHPQIWDYLIKNKFLMFASMPVPILILGILGTALLIYLTCSSIDCICNWGFKKLKLSSKLTEMENKLLHQKGRFDN